MAITERPASVQVLPDIVKQAAASHADFTAVDHEDGNLTYSELERATNCFARILQLHGVAVGDRVPLITAHGTRNIIALGGILEAGACYVPIDRDSWSADRIKHVLTVIDGRVIVNTTGVTFNFPGYRVVDFSSLNQLQKPAASFTQPESCPEALACIIFTSGSTGKPKGVMIPHRAVINYALTRPFNMEVGPGDRVLHILSVAFDASTGMLFSILAGCGTVVPTSKLDLQSKAYTCSILASTPSILAALIPPAAEQYTKLHTVLLGGETIAPNLIKTWCSKSVRILNAYGPTEAATASLMHVITDENKGISHAIVGKPMENGPVSLLGPNLETLVERGTEGEIAIGGEGLAHGYWQDPERTAKAFIVQNGQRLYRTGDYGRWIEDDAGQLVVEFRGRRDRIIKNRGFLVNLEADVEAPILEAAAKFRLEAVHTTVFRNKIIALVSPATTDAQSMRDHLIQNLPAQMVPDRIVAIARLPMSANGKVDPNMVNKTLSEYLDGPEPNDTGAEDIHTTGSDRDLTWRLLKRCIKKVLGMGLSQAADLHKSSNLLAWGASSLDMQTLVSLCHSYGLDIRLRDLYTLPSLEDVCNSAKPMTIPASPKPAGMITHNDLNSLSVAPLTPLQLELAQPTMANDGRNTNQIRFRYACEHAERIQIAWSQVWMSLPVFRTQLSFEGGSGTQNVQDLPLNLPERQVFSERSSYLNATARTPLTVGLGTRLNFLVYQGDESEDVHSGEMTVIWTIHHCLADGYATAAVLAQVELVAAGETPMSLPSIFPVVDQLVLRQRTEGCGAKAFWEKYLVGVSAVENLGLPRPDSRDVESDSRPDKIAAEEIRFTSSVSAEELRAGAARHQVTVATIILTAWAMVISKYTDQDIVTVGTVVSGRSDPMLANTAVGCLIANLPLVVDLTPGRCVAQVLSDTMYGVLSISEYTWSTPEHINHRASTVVALQNDHPSYDIKVPRLSAESFENTAHPLSLLVEHAGIFRVVFDPSVYQDVHMRDIIEYFQRALKIVVALDSNAEQSPILPPSEVEEHRILSQWNSDSNQASTLNKYGNGSSSTLQEAIHTSICRFSGFLALDGPGMRYTYRELGHLSDIVAQAISLFSPPAAGKPIAIHADGSVEWIIGIIGIIKSGSPYCPLDPQYPLSRRTAVCNAAGAVAVVFPSVASKHEDPVAGTDRPSLVVADILTASSAGAGDTKQDDGLVPKSLGIHSTVRYIACPSSDAVMVFTSGTTGAPKGVPISHRGLLALQSNEEARMFSRPGRRIAQMMSPAFDYCANEIFSALLHGGTLVLRHPDDPYAHLRSADVATLTPSLMGVLDSCDYPRLSMVYATGEAVTPGLVQQWGQTREFYNAYGPAEASICVSFTRLRPGELITIGRALPTARMYILDRHGQHQPIGALGELYLAGAHVGRGYQNAEVLSKKHFVPDPWYPGERMYKTGDFCRWTQDGQVDYIGRLDRQVKVRGFRVELPTIEQQIYAADPSVELAVVMVINDGLVSVVKPASVDTFKLKAALFGLLQPTWVPRKILAMEELPLTQNKKVDTRALLKLLESGRVPGGLEQTDRSDKEDDNDIDSRLTGKTADLIRQLWSDLLKLEAETRIKASDRFCDLGGHSILQMLLSARLSSHLKVKIMLRDVILADSLLDLIELVETKLESKGTGPATGTSTVDDQDQKPGSTALSGLELYQYRECMAGDSSAFNIPLVAHLRGDFCLKRLVRAMNAVLASMEIFRSNFLTKTSAPGALPGRILRTRPPVVREAPVPDLQQELNHTFRLHDDELIRLHFWEGQLVLVASHMIADLTTLRNFFKTVSAVYQHYVAGADLDTCPTSARLSRSVTDYTSLEMWSKPVSPDDIAFWQDYLRGAATRPPNLGRPVGLCDTPYRGRSKVIALPQPAIQAFSSAMHIHRVTHHQMALALVFLTLQRASGATQEDSDFILGAPYSGRTTTAEQDAMGLLVDRLPVRIGPAKGMSFAAFLSQIKDRSQAALARALPFPTLLDALHVDPVFEVMVTFHLDQGPVEQLQLGHGSTIKSSPVYASGAKFMLMFEWTALGEEGWMLRIEYDDQRISCETLQSIEMSLFRILGKLGSDDVGEGMLDQWSLDV